MSVAAVVGKAGGAGLLMVGVPGACYLAKDHIFYYEIERKIMSGDEKVKIPTPTSTPAGEKEAKFVTTVSSNSEDKWTCNLFVKPADSNYEENTDKDKLLSKIKELLDLDSSSGNPKTTADETKKPNIIQLVKDCSNNREVNNEGKVITKLFFSVKKDSTKKTLIFELFGKELNVSTI